MEIETGKAHPAQFGDELASERRMTLKERTDNRILNFRDLDVWQKSMLLAESCYTVVARLPLSERFGLALQMRRAVVSIPSNIAEGHQLPTAAYGVTFLLPSAAWPSCRRSSNLQHASV
jgi:hypothetical protein